MTPNSIKNSIYTSCFLLLVTGLALYANYHELLVRHFFFADDWNWLYSAEFRSYSDLFSLWPRQVYNDRPIGAILIKVIYGIFGLNYEAFIFSQVFLHALNSILLYFITKRYIGNAGGLVAAGLSAAWVSANAAVYWTGAVFDLLGSTLCLLSILFWQLSRKSKYKIFYVCTGALFYFLAVRTKEFSILLPVFLFMISIVLDKQPLGKTIKESVPYLIVMLLLGLRYAYLLSNSLLIGNRENVYGFDYSSIISNFWFYFSKLFYLDAFGQAPAVIALATFLIVALVSIEYRKLLFICFSGFLILLGPTLLLSNHLDALYLYAPHHFIAFAIGALCILGWHGRLLSVVMAVLLVVVPLNSAWYANVSSFNSSKSSKNLGQYNSLFQVVDHFEQGSVIYIYGLEKYFNPFSYGPGNSLKIRAKDASLSVRVEKEREIMITEFCTDKLPKYFISYEDLKAKDETPAIINHCQQKKIEELF